jgi:hypothetical protein
MTSKASLLVIVEDVAVRLIECREQAFLEEMETSSELALESQQVGPLAIRIWSFHAKHLVQ